MEVITNGIAGIPADNAKYTRNERIMLYKKIISESVGGKKQNDEH